MTYCYSVYHDNFRDSIGQCTGIHRRITGSSPGRTAVRASQGIGFASLRVLDRLVHLCKPVIKAAMPPFANENQLRSKTFLISQPNYNKNKRSSQCDYERKSKHSKCSYTCDKRRGLTGICKRQIPRPPLIEAPLTGGACCNILPEGSSTMA